MLVLVHRILETKHPNTRHHYESWTIEEIGDLVGDYLELETKLGKELDDSKIINHYCMFQISRDIICYSELDGREEARELLQTVTSIAYILKKGDAELIKSAKIYLDQLIKDSEWLREDLILREDSN